MTTLFPVILSGGSGTRLWPLSRAAKPKQFLPLTSNRSLFQETVERVRPLEGARLPFIVCNRDHRYLVVEQLEACGCAAGEILLEPVGRNTAPAITAAALRAVAHDPEALLLALPSDHLVRDTMRFRASVEHAARVAASGAIVTFGVLPGWPETGYGYIERGEPFAHCEGAFRVARFVEKPDLARAREMLAGGRHLWNSGMFMFRADVLLGEVDRLCPDVRRACESALANAREDGGFRVLDETAFASAPAVSIDYGVMEHTPRAAVLPVDMGWSDVGSWASLWEVCDKDGEGNAVAGDVHLDGVSDSLVRAGHRTVAAVGLSDVIIVETSDAVLVAQKDSSQRVRQIVDRLGAGAGVRGNRVSRPWGWFESIDSDDGYQVKRIVVHPGGKLSLQYHHHRSEHWVVVGGLARVTRGEETFELRPNESAFIPLGIRHRLENPGTEPLRLIEVQVGSYVGEDDIVRIEDAYRRV